MAALRLLPRINVAAAATRSVVAIAPAPASRRALHASAAAASKDPQLGDYPDLPKISRQHRKWNPNWSDPQEKRNFGEPLHEQELTLGVWAPDVHDLPGSSALKQLAIAALVFASFAGLVVITSPEMPAFRRTYPRDGLALELGTDKANALAEGAFDEDAEEGEDEEE